jgi:hypothetical protein
MASNIRRPREYKNQWRFTCCHLLLKNLGRGMSFPCEANSSDGKLLLAPTTFVLSQYSCLGAFISSWATFSRCFTDGFSLDMPFSASNSIGDNLSLPDIFTRFGCSSWARHRGEREIEYCYQCRTSYEHGTYCTALVVRVWS